jgi:hypothetical protein
MGDNECWDSSVVRESSAFCNGGCGDKANDGYDSEGEKREHVDLQALNLAPQVPKA